MERLTKSLGRRQGFRESSDPASAAVEARDSGIAGLLVEERSRFLAFVRSRVETPELAEDLLQAAYVKAFEHGLRLRSRERAAAWFYRILRNVVIDHYRRTGAAPHSVEEEAASHVAIKPRESPNICPCVRRELRTLKAEYAAALRDVDMDGVPVQDHACPLGIEANNVSVRLHRARKALKKRLLEACGACAGAGCFDCTCSRAENQGDTLRSSGISKV